MSAFESLLRRLENASDRLSPIVVKEVRQVARGREFASSFAATLLAGLGIAFFSAGDALSGSGTSGSWAFGALMTCLAFLGLAVVPLGAFNALRTERMEQTLELITVTALSPRRVVVGKLLAQAVKLATFFAVMAPFIAMSFLLGGIDFVTILLSLVLLFLWSVWVCALSLFLSTLLKSRAVSGLLFGVAGLVMFAVVSFVLSNMRTFGAGFAVGLGGGPSTTWWILGMTTTFCLVSMVNLVLLAENRLSLPTEDKVTVVRAGFLVQFALIVAWALAFINYPARIKSNAVDLLGFFAGLHLALVALFTVTEDLVVSRRVFLTMQRPSGWGWMVALLRPGGGRGAAYVLAQMAVLLLVVWLFDVPTKMRWALAICGYICLFTGVPAVAFRRVRPLAHAALKLRLLLLVLLVAALLLPDVIHYVVWRPEVLNLNFSRRHLINPFRTLANWHTVEMYGWHLWPFALTAAGVLAYAALIRLGWSAAVQTAPETQPGTAAEPKEPTSVNVFN